MSSSSSCCRVVKVVVVILIVAVIVVEAVRKIKGKGENEVVVRQNERIVLRMPYFVGAKPRKAKARLNVRPVLEDCRSASFNEQLQRTRKETKCEPRPTVVHLESTTNSTLIPNAVLVNKCAGMCGGSLKCVAVETRQITKYLREIKMNEIYCTSVVVTEDVRCMCDCPQKASDCNPLQEYDRDTCRCNCKNEGDRKNCEDPKRAKKWMWDESRCECTCRRVKSCTTNTVWSPKHCSCKPDPKRT